MTHSFVSRNSSFRICPVPPMTALRGSAFPPPEAILRSPRAATDNLWLTAERAMPAPHFAESGYNGARPQGLLGLIFSAGCEALRRFGKGSVHKTFDFPERLSMHIAVPPHAEQTRIVAEMERRLSVVEELESVVTANLQRATRLRQSILQRAFTGELTGWEEIL